MIHLLVESCAGDGDFFSSARGVPSGPACEFTHFLMHRETRFHLRGMGIPEVRNRAILSQHGEKTS
jgi:hypothetical protein